MIRRIKIRKPRLSDAHLTIPTRITVVGAPPRPRRERRDEENARRAPPPPSRRPEESNRRKKRDAPGSFSNATREAGSLIGDWRTTSDERRVTVPLLLSRPLRLRVSPRRSNFPAVHATSHAPTGHRRPPPAAARRIAAFASASAACVAASASSFSSRRISATANAADASIFAADPIVAAARLGAEAAAVVDGSDAAVVDFDGSGEGGRLRRIRRDGGRLQRLGRLGHLRRF